MNDDWEEPEYLFNLRTRSHEMLDALCQWFEEVVFVARLDSAIISRDGDLSPADKDDYDNSTRSLFEAFGWLLTHCDEFGDMVERHGDELSGAIDGEMFNCCEIQSRSVTKWTHIVACNVVSGVSQGCRLMQANPTGIEDAINACADDGSIFEVFRSVAHETDFPDSNSIRECLSKEYENHYYLSHAAAQYVNAGAGKKNADPKNPKHRPPQYVEVIWMPRLEELEKAKNRGEGTVKQIIAAQQWGDVDYATAALKAMGQRKRDRQKAQQKVRQK